MASQGQMIVKMPNGQIEVKARRRLKETGAFEAFVEEIQTTLIQMKESHANAMVSDFDVSQNPITHEQFEMLFNALALAGVKVQRFRMFGCPALNDEAMRHIADHFSQDLTSETAPTEMHLSDCAITTDGFLLLMSAIEEKELYPTTMGGRKLPLYLRLENNYVDEAVIQEKVDAGIIRPYKKAPGTRQETTDPGIKINLVVREEGKYQQKTGDPPAPEDAPPPKDVHDQGYYNKGQGQNNGNNNWRQGAQGWPQQGWQPQQVRPQWANNNMQGWRPAAAATQALPGRWAPRPQAVGPVRPQVVRPQFNAAAQGTIRPRVVPGQVGVAGVRPAAWQQQGWGARGTAGGAADRSRTPAARNNNGGAGPFPPSKPPPKKNSGLPPNWEEQWSDEYQIPYFWNSESGESMWEKPTA